MRLPFLLPILALLLWGCASYDGRGLQPGAATEADIRQLMGPPAMEFDSPDRSRTLTYARGPLGEHTFMVRIRPDGKLGGIEQVLDEAHFALIVKDRTTRDEVRLLLGPPGSSMEFPGTRRVAWTYRFRDMWGIPADFSPVFDANGVVVDKVTIRVESAVDR